MKASTKLFPVLVDKKPKVFFIFSTVGGLNKYSFKQFLLTLHEKAEKSTVPVLNKHCNVETWCGDTAPNILNAFLCSQLHAVVFLPPGKDPQVLNE
jgi:hypothetical protein